MEKMDGKTMDIAAENVGKLKELFPEAFTEDGTTEHTEYTEKKKIDFEVLKKLLGEYVSDKDERYSFTWNGKSKARMLAQTPSTGTLRPCKEESVDWDTTQNIFIEGDNLEVLKLLQKSYHKKVKMIYIDPPYNTGHDFVYKDNFKDNIKNYKEITGQVDGEGRNLSSNPETSGRYHTDWLNMMYPRLKVARNLLMDDGAIFISIDDNEVTNLRNMCNEIFGEENFIACLCWQKRYSRENRGAIGDAHEYILVFSRKNNLFAQQSGRIPLSEEQAKVYRNPNDDPKGRWRGIPMTAQGYRPNQMYEITTPSGNKFAPPEGRCWSTVEPEYLKLKNEGRIYFGKNDDSQPQIIRYLSEVEGVVPWTWLPHEEGGHTDESKKEMYNIFGKGFEFDTPKPSKLLKRLITICSCEKDFIILDFFSGSSTTAHATIQLNSEDDGRRKYIMVQLPEPCNSKTELPQNGFKNIAEIGKERIRRAAAKIKEENPDYEGDLGFKVFKLDSTNIKPWEVDFDLTERTLEDFISNIKTDRREEDVLFEVLLKYGLDLTLPITDHTISGQKVFDIGMGALIICLSDVISLEVVEGIAKLKDELNPEIMRVVFKDSGFKDDVVKTNAVQILKQAGIVDVRSL